VNDRSPGLADNRAFAPGSASSAARHTLAGALAIEDAPITLAHGFDQRLVLGKRIDRFPAFTLHVATSAEELVPIERGLVPSSEDQSYWSVIASPGRVWFDAEDGGRSRAALPFALCHPLENDTHNGVLTFTFDGHDVRDVRFQIVQFTAPYMVPGSVVGGGDTRAAFTPSEPDGFADVIHDREQERQGRFVRRPWSDLTGRSDSASDVDGALGGSAIVHALVIDDELFAQPCRSEAGDFPYPDDMVFGVWSVTKSAFAGIASLRLAQLFGDEVLQSRVADLLDVTAEHDGWDDVTIADCLDMATGIGDAGPEPEPLNILADDGVDPSDASPSGRNYRTWIEARTKPEKLAAAFACGRYPWGPGRFARYRDQDIFIAGAAMDRLLERRTDGRATLWATIVTDVYRRIGASSLDATHTGDPASDRPIPVSAFGLFADLDSLAKIARLLQAGGQVDGEQILSRSLTSALLGRSGPPPRPTGQFVEGGEYGYRQTMWYAPFRSRSGHRHHVPCMLGYGGNGVVLMPNGITGLRVAHDPARVDDAFWDPTTLIRIADEIRPF
jgi:CubicO group peptidase (beta-lactamase class C family)